MRKLFGFIAAGALALGAPASVLAAPVTTGAGGQMSIVIGTLPALPVPIAPGQALDYTGGVLTVPPTIASVAGFFAPVTGFPLNLITGIVVTASNGAGSFAPGFAPTGGDLCPNAGTPVNGACIPGGGTGGIMPLVGAVHIKGPLALDVPVHVIGAGGVVSVMGIIVEGAPWTTGAAKVTTTGPVMAMYPANPTQAVAFQGTNMLTAGGGGSITLVTPAHNNAAGLTRLPVLNRLILNLVGSIVDADGDGVGDNNDNCPFMANADQADAGGIGAASGPDGIGNACQCGDVSGDGKVTTGDAVIISRSLLSPPTATQAHPELCDVNGNGTCTIADVVISRRAQLVPPTASIGQTCAPTHP